jgi:predicted nuclease of predicted toxin-antitoxin system
MKLLFDENLSPRLPFRLADLFPNSFPMKPPKIVSAQAINDHTLLIEFSQNEFKKYDIS